MNCGTSPFSPSPRISVQAQRSVHLPDATLLVVLAVIALLVWGCGDDGGGDDGPGPASSGDVHAAASLLVVNDAVGERVVAQIIIVAIDEDGSARFVDQATDAKVAFGGDEVSLANQLVQLSSGEQTRFYRVDSRANPSLAYTPGETYTFSFTLLREREGSLTEVEHTLVASAPTLQNSVEPASVPERDKQLDIVTPQDFEFGIVEVVRVDNDEVTYVSFPREERQVAGPQQVLDAVDSLSDFGGGILTVPSDAFVRGGTHAITYFGLNAVTGSGAGTEVGNRSSVIIGTSAAAEVDIP